MILIYQYSMRTILLILAIFLLLTSLSESKKKNRKKNYKIKSEPSASQISPDKQTIEQKAQKRIESEEDKQKDSSLSKSQPESKEESDQGEAQRVTDKEFQENFKNSQEISQEIDENENEEQEVEEEDYENQEEGEEEEEEEEKEERKQEKTESVAFDKKEEDSGEEEEQDLIDEEKDTQIQEEAEQFQDSLAKTIDYLINNFYSSMEHLTREFIKFVYHTKIFYKFINNMIPYHRQKIYYENNYASLNGGAKIIMKSSAKIKSINSILDDSVDKYMYTEEKLPIKIVIGLNEEIAIESIIITSMEMYSSITKQFSVDGKFSMEDSKWVPLGLFTAQNQFGPQQFFTERKIVRYIRIKVRSAYGAWSYFTLTQVKIKGKGLFADAFAQLTRNQAESDLQETLLENQPDHDHYSNTTQHINFCENSFKVQSQEPHESNLITSLMRKIQNLEDTNSGQAKTLQMLSQTMTKLTTELDVKREEAKTYKQMTKKYEHENGKLYYFILINTAISAITIISLICICLMRKKTLITTEQT